VPIPIIHIEFFNAEALRTQRIAEKKAIDSAVLRDLRVSALRTIKTKTQCPFLGIALVRREVRDLAGKVLVQICNICAISVQNQ